MFQSIAVRISKAGAKSLKRPAGELLPLGLLNCPRFSFDKLSETPNIASQDVQNAKKS